MIDLGSRSKGTNTDSWNWLKSSKNFRVKIYSESGSKLKNWNSSSHLFSHNGMWLCKIGDSCSRITSMTIKTDSKMLVKLGNKTWVNLIQKLELDHIIEDRDHIPDWVQFHENENLPLFQCDSQKCGIGQVQYVNLEK